MEKLNSRNNALDVFKAIAAIFVVFIHCRFPGVFGDCVVAIARFAVPLFFMVSGYFLYNDSREKMNASIPRKVKKLLIIALISGFVYFFIKYAEDFFLSGFKMTIIDFLKETVTIEAIVHFIIVNKPLYNTARWFLFALIYCYLFRMLINKTRFANKISNITAFAFLFTLIILEFSNYVTGSLVNFAIFKHELGYEFLFIIRAWPWFVFGMICRQFVSKISKLSANTCIITLVVGIVLTLIQSLQGSNPSVYIGTIFIVIGGFFLCIRGENKQFSSYVVHVGRDLSLYVYLVHGAVISVTSLFETLLWGQGENALFLWVKPIIVVVGSIIASDILNVIMNRLININKKRQLSK